MHNQRLDENRIKESDWFTITFDDETINKAKKIRANKDSMWDNRFESENRWIGYLGELAFRTWAYRTGLPYKHWDMRDEKDIRDFTMGRLEIDVKTVATNYYPKMYYGCEVTTSQIDNETVNAYVFCRYILKTNEIVVMGWLPKSDFLNKSVERKKGEKVTEKFTVSADMYEVKIYQLKKLIDIDRFS